MRETKGLALSLFLLSLPAWAQSAAPAATVTFSSSTLSTSATAVDSGGTVGAGGQANSSASGDTIAYAWSAACNGGLGSGTFSNASASTTKWTAPPNATGSDQTCSLTLSAMATPSGASASLATTLTVSAQSGGTSPGGTASGGSGGNSTVALDTLTPDSIYRTGNIVQAGATIYVGLHLDPGQTASGLTFLWADHCTGGIGNGAFSSSAASAPSWTAPNNMSGSTQSCAFTVTISDSAGNQVTLPFPISVAAAGTGDSAAGNSVANATPQNGWWWAPSVAGIGFSIEVNAAGAIFLGAYMYDSGGNPVWYAANLASNGANDAGIPPGGVFGSGGSPSSASAGGWTGTLQFYTGGPALGAAYQAPKSTASGSVSLSCSTAQQCAVGLPGSTSPLTIERYAFVDGGTSRSIADASGMPQTGWWWNSGASGVGYFVEVQSDSAGNDIAFVAYYLYDQSGNPRWFVTDGTMNASGGVFGSGGSATADADAVQCSGGASLDNLVALPTQCSAMASGQIEDAFTSATAGTVDYLDDNKLTIPIQRFSF